MQTDRCHLARITPPATPVESGGYFTPSITPPGWGDPAHSSQLVCAQSTRDSAHAYQQTQHGFPRSGTRNAGLRP
jgi:hypothetical protein